MLRLRAWRPLLAAGFATAVAAGLLGQSPVGANTSSYRPMPTGAYRPYRWGPASWKDEFESRMTPQWRFNHPNMVMNRMGMLTLRGRANGRPVVTTLSGHAFRYGRWEARVRVREWNQERLPYRVTATLIPVKGAYHCGARNITFADYTDYQKRAQFTARNLPNKQFTYSVRPYLGTMQWNTFGVELTPTNISWFVDDHVVMTERRPAALSGAKYTLQFRISGPGSGSFLAPWMQMDWARYWTLRLPNALSIKAPRATQGSYANAC